MKTLFDRLKPEYLKILQNYQYEGTRDLTILYLKQVYTFCDLKFLAVWNLETIFNLPDCKILTIRNLFQDEEA